MHNLLPSLVLNTRQPRCPRRFFDQYQQYKESRDPSREALGPQIGALDHRYSSASTSVKGIEVIWDDFIALVALGFPRMQTSCFERTEAQY